MRKAIVGAALGAFLAAALAPVAAQVSTAPGGTVSEEAMITETVVVDSPQQFIVRVRDQEVALQNEPLRIGANILVPLRESLEALGAEDIRFDSATGQITFIYQGRQGIINVRSQQATWGGNPISIPGPLQLVDGSYYVRSEFLSSLDPTFEVTRVRVAGFRGGQGFPEAAPVTSFSFGGNTFNFGSPTFYTGGVLMVPLSDALSALGVDDNYRPGDLQITFAYNGQNVLLNATSGYAYVGTQQWVLDRPVSVYQDRVYVPATFLARLAPGFDVIGGEMRL